MKVVEDRFPKDDGKILVTCIGISSGIGRLISGPISDFKKVDRIVIQQVYYIIILVFFHYKIILNKYIKKKTINCNNG